MNYTTEDLAEIVCKKLENAKTEYPHPSEIILRKLFAELFFASLKTEEGQLTRVTITLIDPNDPDPNPPERIVAHRWNCINFEERIPFSVKNLVKLSKAADPLSASLAVYYENNSLFIWGMVDQAIHYQSFLNYEGDSEPEQPGLFQATIADVGNIYVMFDYELIATLKQNVLISNYIDVFRQGPVNAILKKSAELYKKQIRSYVKQEFPGEKLEEWEKYTEDFMSEAISRILLVTQEYQHGGAFLLTANAKRSGLSIKHALAYDRLFNTITNNIKLEIANYVHTNTIVTEYLEPEKDAIPTVDYLKENIADYEKKDASDELKGTIRFIGSLSCIDGLVVLAPDLRVQGFGAVIKMETLPEQVFISKTATASQSALSPITPNHFGTRHRSMFSYCWNNEGSLGFVISQDGDIRAITRVEDKLVMWENIKVQRFIKSEKLSRSMRFGMRK